MQQFNKQQVFVCLFVCLFVYISLISNVYEFLQVKWHWNLTKETYVQVQDIEASFGIFSHLPAHFHLQVCAH